MYTEEYVHTLHDKIHELAMLLPNTEKYFAEPISTVDILQMIIDDHKEPKPSHTHG